MVPVYHCPYEERVLVLLCVVLVLVVGRQLETASISDFVTIDNASKSSYLVGRIRLRLALTGVK